MTPYNDELLFEQDFVKYLYTACGWEKNIIKNPTEEDLIVNWAQILFDNNKDADHLNGHPLTKGEMQQIVSIVDSLKSPYKLNQFINGGSVTINRDNPDDPNNLGKPVTLKIYSRNEIAAGSSRYQIVEQPRFKTTNNVYPTRRGDVMLLINGMPVYHIELKKSNVDISQAERQIEKYMVNNAFSGLFSLIQVFIAMNPEDAVYFANPGPQGKFNPLYYFHWTDSQNNYIREWNKFAHSLLMIPRAHEIIGFYTVPDGSDGILKVLRPYQIYAAEDIFNKVSAAHWTKQEQKAGYVWHTTGSGKTLTSFKTAQLISNTNIADKVVFLIDRVELGEQSYLDYTNFANIDDSINDTSNTNSLINLLTSSDKDEKVIVTSIQKMSRIKPGEVPNSVITKIKSKRVVFIVDECHRDQNGDMHQQIEHTFPSAMFFGFTGTPDHKETSDIFGNELHRYTIAQAVREFDKNVLGFDRYKVCIYKDNDMRMLIGLKKANATTVAEALNDPAKKEVFDFYMNRGNKKCPMTIVEKEIPASQFQTDEYRSSVVKDIIDNWTIRSSDSLFHSIFATSSIKEAIEYYRIFARLKEEGKHNLNVSALFDPSDDNGNNAVFKMGGITDILNDYGKMFGVYYDHANYRKFKKDLCLRLAHKEPYKKLSKDQQINIVIVVDQLLTGFDSKWINTVYLDKLLQGKNFIQAASRTNRLYGPEKKHGTIVWYRYPHLTEAAFDKAVDEYSGSQPFGIFVDKLEKNLGLINSVYNEIKDHFESFGITNFERNEEDDEWKKKFARLFSLLNDKIESAKLQGFFWGQYHYDFNHDDGTLSSVEVNFDKNIYLTLLQRYKELFSKIAVKSEPPFAIDPYIVEMQVDTIDESYMNSRFKQYMKNLNNGDAKAKQKALDDLHKTFASLSQEDKTFAKQFLNDVENGLPIASDKNLSDYIADYKAKAYNDEIHVVAVGLGVDESKLKALMNRHPTVATIKSFGDYDELFDGLDIAKARAYLESKLNKPLTKNREVKVAADSYLRGIIINGL